MKIRAMYKCRACGVVFPLNTVFENKELKSPDQLSFSYQFNRVSMHTTSCVYYPYDVKAPLLMFHKCNVANGEKIFGSVADLLYFEEVEEPLNDSSGNQGDASE